MSLNFIAATTATGANANPAIPAGVSAGDILIMVASSGTVFSATPPTGYTELYRNTVASPFLTIWYKITGATETAVAATNASTATVAARLLYSAQLQGILRDGLGTVATATSTAPATTSITTNFYGETIVSCYACVLNNPSANWTAATGTTQRVSLSTTAALTGMLVADEYDNAPGTSTARTATLSRSLTWQAIAFSLRDLFQGSIVNWTTVT